MPVAKDPSLPPTHASLPRPAGAPVAGVDPTFGYVPPPAALPIRTVCRAVAQMTGEMVALNAHRVLQRRDRRRELCHVRQIAMYVCHVALRIPFAEIGRAFGRDRTSVGHACHVVEDRRDDPAFDDFVSAVERIATSAFSAVELGSHE
ncbi:helix-turn-helix domain-containing protein [Rhizobium sp. BK251]|uniref:helix-turn-helix domain-containing protein n=1 Tax=Rhizobium sp. BK251 TaxID=2512125 RepID=UPI0010E25B93|nr:helix-turn-helix domain-containing protein [Rhizobium sp. BK251]TCL76118.1 DnaA-like protein [Rhizobium sp. BK251]